MYHFLLYLSLIGISLSNSFDIKTLIPFGPDDFSLSAGDDAFAGPISIGNSFRFFNTSYQSLFVNTNGLISFENGIVNYTAIKFPLKNYKCVAPFWDDIDTRNGGTIYFRVIGDTNSLNQITNEIRAAFPKFKTFTTKWAFHVTWYQVAEYYPPNPNPNPNPNQRNTFQAVLATDNQYSFTIFNYRDLMWSKGKSQAGFNAGDGINFFILPGSFSSSVLNLTKTSNVGVPGKWIFRIDSNVIIDPECDADRKISINPSDVYFVGNEEVTVTGYCIKDSDTLKINFVSLGIQVDCVFKDKKTCFFTTSYLRQTGKISFQFIVNNRIVYESNLMSKSFSFKQQVYGLRNYYLRNTSEEIRIEWQGITGRTYDIYLVQIFEKSSIEKILIKNVNQNFTLIQSSLLFQQSTSIIRYCYILIYEVSIYRRITYSYQVSLLSIEQSVDYGSVVTTWHQSQSSSLVYVQNLPVCWTWIPLEKNGQPPYMFNGFIMDDTCNPFNTNGCFSEAKVCYISMKIYRTARQRCCYNIQYKLIVTGYGSGSLLIGWTDDYWEYFTKNLQMFFYSCIITNYNYLYYEKRPIDDGKRWQPVYAGGGNGHFITLDRVRYTFNGYGEYSFLSIREINFNVQVRLNPSTYSSKASYFRAIAIKGDSGVDSLQFEINTQNELIMYLKGSKVDINNYMTEWYYTLKGVYLRIETNRIVLNYLSGITFELKINDKFDSFMIFSWVSNTYIGKTSGLLGNMNLNDKDDLEGVQDPENDKEVFQKFGQQWLINETSSIFTYTDGQSHSNFVNRTYIPSFISDGIVFSNFTVGEIANQKCSQNKQCLFDIFVSNDLDRANLTIDLFDLMSQYELDYEKQVNDVCPSFNVTNGSYQIGYLPNMGSIGITFSCDKNFCLNGPSNFNCSQPQDPPECFECPSTESSTDPSTVKIVTTTVEPSTTMDTLTAEYSQPILVSFTTELRTSSEALTSESTNTELRTLSVPLTSASSTLLTTLSLNSTTSTRTTTTRTPRSTTLQTVIPFGNSTTCDFEDETSSCLILFNNNTSEFVRLTYYYEIPEMDFVITDWNSFNTPTLNNKNCSIPFEYDEQTYHTCAKIDDKIKCLTEDGDFDECNVGKFIAASSFSKNGRPFSEEIKFNFKPEVKGRYKLKFKALLFFSDPNECKTAFDFIEIYQITLNSQGFCQTRIAEVNYKNIGSENMWVEKEAVTLPNNDQFLNITVILGRKNPSRAISIVGFDNLELTLDTQIENEEETDSDLIYILVGAGGAAVLAGCIGTAAIKKRKQISKFMRSFGGSDNDDESTDGQEETSSVYSDETKSVNSEDQSEESKSEETISESVEYVNEIKEKKKKKKKNNFKRKRSQDSDFILLYRF